MSASSDITPPTSHMAQESHRCLPGGYQVTIFLVYLLGLSVLVFDLVLLVLLQQKGISY